MAFRAAVCVIEPWSQPEWTEIKMFNAGGVPAMKRFVVICTPPGNWRECVASFVTEAAAKAYAAGTQASNPKWAVRIVRE